MEQKDYKKLSGIGIRFVWSTPPRQTETQNLAVSCEVKS